MCIGLGLTENNTYSNKNINSISIIVIAIISFIIMLLDFKSCRYQETQLGHDRADLSTVFFNSVALYAACR